MKSVCITFCSPPKIIASHCEFHFGLKTCECVIVCAHFSGESCSFSVVHVDRISWGFMCSSFVLLKQHKIQKNQRNDLSRRSVVVSISCIVGIPHPNLNMLYHHHHHHHCRCRLLVRFSSLSLVVFLFILYHFSLVSFHALWCVCMARAHFVCNNKSKILFNTMIVLRWFSLICYPFTENYIRILDSEITDALIFFVLLC